MPGSPMPPFVRPVNEVLPLEVVSPVPAAPVAPSRQASWLWRALCWVVGWAWRITAGVFLCFNAPLLSYLTSILVLGWFNRWVRGRVLFAWWRQSGARGGEVFAEHGETDGKGQPVTRPRWLLPEKWGKAPALWLNLRGGVATFFCLYLVLGWGCLLMLFSWEMGWLNSFSKGYEQAWIGPVTGIIGSLLLILGIIYVPMARVHLAVMGEVRAFFEVRFVW